MAIKTKQQKIALLQREISTLQRQLDEIDVIAENFTMTNDQKNAAKKRWNVSIKRAKTKILKLQ